MATKPKTTHPYKPAKLADFEIVTWQEPTQGCSESVLQQIIDKSQQERMSNLEDATKRFKNPSTYKSWANSGKLFFALTEYSGEVGGLIWFSQKQNSIVPDADMSFAIRMYDGYEGRGLARPFMNVAHFMLPKLMEVSGHTWLETDADNYQALGLYKSFGYRQIETSETERVLMSYHSVDGQKNE